ncbi:nicotinamidase-related amidase [Humitalea rosea]|uniref:Nicotinamidase-related amidase n=1 Tax=Humitalea rosea TaxID=990373 RepID=A0A2W7IWL5_9PROT|nr:cysteine hydrolase [Humitalea rosea]PZW50912.1 nicotinamidase-related amidase [Humitalea rosea]
MRSIYLVLDMENDLVAEDGPSGKGPLGQQVRERGIIARTATAIAKARAAGVPIGFVRVGFSPDYRECPTTSAIFGGAKQHGLFKLGTRGTEVHADLAPQPGDFDIVKHRVSPFYGTSLEPVLRAHGIERIFLSGVSTVAVVQGTVRDAHDRDYVCVVLEDCCAAASAVDHAAAIAVLQRFTTFTTSEAVDFAA